MELGQVSKSKFKVKALEFFRQIETSGESLIVTDHREVRLDACRHREITHNPCDILHGYVMHYESSIEPIAVDDWEAMQ